MQPRNRFRSPQDRLIQAFVLTALVVMGALAVAGPAGLLAWRENSRVLEEQRSEIDRLSAERDVLRNRVDLLDPRHADPDLVGELLRRNLNVAHPDEVVVPRP